MLPSTHSPVGTVLGRPPHWGMLSAQNKNKCPANIFPGRLCSSCSVFHSSEWKSNPFVETNLLLLVGKYNGDGWLWFPYFGTTSGLKCVCDGSGAEKSPQEPQLRWTRCYFFSRLKYSGQKNGLVVPCTLQFYVPVLQRHRGLSDFWEEYHSLDFSNILQHKGLVDATVILSVTTGSSSKTARL